MSFAQILLQILNTLPLQLPLPEKSFNKIAHLSNLIRDLSTEVVPQYNQVQKLPSAGHCLVFYNHEITERGSRLFLGLIQIRLEF